MRNREWGRALARGDLNPHPWSPMTTSRFTYTLPPIETLPRTVCALVGRRLADALRVGFFVVVFAVDFLVAMSSPSQVINPNTWLCAPVFRPYAFPSLRIAPGDDAQPAGSAAS